MKHRLASSSTLHMIHAPSGRPSSARPLCSGVRGETVWKIAGRPLEGALLAPGGANRLLFAPSWRPYIPRFGTHSEFPNSFGRVILRSSCAGSWITYSETPPFQLRASTTPRRLAQHLGGVHKDALL